MVRTSISLARLSVSLLPALVASLAACSSADDGAGSPPASTEDSGVPTGTTLSDSGSRVADARSPGADTGTGSAAPTDSGSTHDSGSPGMSNKDSGPVSVPSDAGVTGPTGTPTSLIVQVTNSCPVDVWIHGQGMEGTLAPDNVHLVPGSAQQYYGPLTWTAARIYAYLQAPDGSGNPQGQNDKVEMNFSTSGGVESLNTDVTYVDWVALPSKIEAIGTGSDCTTVGCEVPYAQILDGCPASLLTGHECLSAGGYCLDTTHDSDPFCHALDSQVPACASEYTDCAGATGASTAEVYSCSGTFFSQSPEYCAALNRGVLSAPGATTPASSFYVGSPFNTYSAWVHETCPGIYAFPYDDYGSSNQSSDHTCSGATQLNITFCPKG